ncbi:hypothetical protein [Novosphingobium sp.]|uniref:hypothetical protein n=1 Tax=Novosphingobium sp. TaxID=1874826 RepID=UPI003529FB12
MAEIIGGGKFEQVLSALGARLGKKTQVNVGFLEGATYPDGTSVATVAAINNFGAPEAGIPARPFFSDMIQQHKGEWSDTFASVLKSCDYDTDQALELMGTGMMGQLSDAIINTQSPPNSEVTNLLKQRFPTGDGVTFADVQQARRDVAAGATAPAGKPLSWSGNLLHSVDKEVL